MTDIALIKQLKNDITTTCNAYKDEAKNDSELEFTINIIQECAQRAAGSCIKYLQHKEAKENLETAIQQQTGGEQP